MASEQMAEGGEGAVAQPPARPLDAIDLDILQMLQADGYVPAQPATNSPVTPINRTVVYYRNDAAAAQNHADAQFIATKYFKGAKVAQLGVSFTDLAKGATVAIVLGQDYAAAGA